VGALKLGSSRAEALRRMGARVGVPFLRSLAATLVQADRLGASIGPVLRAHAERARDERLARAERAGMYAAQKALVPLVFCIMPVTFIVIFGPLVARFLTGGLNALF